MTPQNTAKEDDSLKHCRGRWLPKRGRWLPKRGRWLSKTLQRKMTPWNTAEEENSLKYCTGRGLPETQQRKIPPKTLLVQEMTLYTTVHLCVIVVGVVIPLTKCVDSGEILCVQPFLWMSTPDMESLTCTTFSVHTVHTKETQALTSQHKYLTLKNWKTVLHPVLSRSQTLATGLF